MATKMVKLASSAGITYFDTAECYSKGASEVQLGKAIMELPLLPRRPVVVCFLKRTCK